MTAADGAAFVERLGVEVPGLPRPKGSMQCIRGASHPLREDTKGVRPGRRAIEKAAAEHLGGPYDGPVGVRATFVLPFGTSLRRAARTWPHVRGSGDVDKLARLVLDALESAGVLTNDAQVCELVARKAYVHSPARDVMAEPGVRVRIYPLDREPDVGEVRRG